MKNIEPILNNLQLNINLRQLEARLRLVEARAENKDIRALQEEVSGLRKLVTSLMALLKIQVKHRPDKEIYFMDLGSIRRSLTSEDVDIWHKTADLYSASADGSEDKE